MTEDTNTTLSSPINFPVTQKQALAIAASEHAVKVVTEVATKLVGVTKWHEQLLRLHRELRNEIYDFLSEK